MERRFEMSVKPNQIMIGDILTFKDCQNDKEPVIIKIWQINQEGEAFVFIDDSDSLDEITIDEEIVELPLTTEIIEKNGWTYNDENSQFHPKTWSGNGIMLKKEIDCFRIVVVSDYDDALFGKHRVSTGFTHDLKSSGAVTV
jgi:hypothetical protein